MVVSRGHLPCDTVSCSSSANGHMWAKLTEGFLYQLKGVTMILFTGHKTRNGEKRLKIWICLLE